jgi:hypothetical protein
MIGSFNPNHDSTARGIKVIMSHDLNALESLQKHLGSPSLSELKRVLGNAFGELDAEAAKVFSAMTSNGENEAMHESKYRKYFLKEGFYGSSNAVCLRIQPRIIIEGEEQHTWIPLPVAIDRRESGIPLPTMLWDLVSRAYPRKVSDKDKHFAPDHAYAVNGKDKDETTKIMLYREYLPGFLLLKGPESLKPPYLIQESKDHENKECEARQYLSLLAASALHDRMLLRWLSDEAQTNKMIRLSPELCIYGMTCCGKLVTLYKMVIRDIWSNSDASKKIGKPVRYDFMRVESLI